MPSKNLRCSNTTDDVLTPKCQNTSDEIGLEHGFYTFLLFHLRTGNKSFNKDVFLNEQ